MPRIYVLSGPDLGRTFDVVSGATFGRTPECAVTLRDASVSRSHARLEQVGDGWRVVDAGSRNGLFVNDVRVPTFDLADGDEFRLGEVQLRFRADASSASSVRGDSSAPGDASEPAAAPGPQIQFHVRGASRAEPQDEPAEIELEGDWSTPAAPQVSAPRPVASGPATVGSRTAPESARSASTPAVAAPRSIASDERARKFAAAGVTATARTGAVDARGVLQFHRVDQQEGLLRQDLEQQPTWLRFAVIVIVLAVASGLGWLGYQAATAAKSRIVQQDVIEDGVDDGTR